MLAPATQCYARPSSRVRCSPLGKASTNSRASGSHTLLPPPPAHRPLSITHVQATETWVRRAADPPAPLPPPHTTTSFLHEAAIIDNLRERFEGNRGQKLVYTYCGCPPLPPPPPPPPPPIGQWRGCQVVAQLTPRAVTLFRAADKYALQ